VAVDGQREGGFVRHAWDSGEAAKPHAVMPAEAGIQ
jgi:hypothetical protein